MTQEEKFVRDLGLLSSTMIVTGAMIGSGIFIVSTDIARQVGKAPGYPIIPALYIIGAATLLVVLYIYQTATTWPGLAIVLSGAPVYLFWRAQARKQAAIAQD